MYHKNEPKVECGSASRQDNKIAIGVI